MINEKGYLRPSYDELLELRIEQAKELFGDDIDTDNNSPLGKYIRLSVQDLADAYEVNEAVYYSGFPPTATGQSLDRLMPFANISRNPATRAEHIIAFTGEAEYEIPVGFLVGTTGEVEFYLVNPVVLDAEGNGEGIVQCTEFGTVGNVKLGAITEIINPDANVASISHVGIEVFAVDEETDEELRSRFSQAVEGSGSGTLSAIRGAVMRVTGVSSCIVVENDTDEADEDGRPPHSFEVYAHALETARQGIADAIFSKKPLGIKTYGKTYETVMDVQGGKKVVNFTLVTEQALYINVTVAVDTHFELDGVEQIKTALMGYVNGLKAGENVIYTKLYEHLHGVAGIVDVPTLTLSTDGSTFAAGNIPVDQHQVVVLDADSIEVEVTTYVD